MLLAANTDGYYYVWNLNAPLSEDKKDKGAPNPMKFKVHSEGLVAVSLNSLDETLYSAGADKNVVVWDMRNSKVPFPGASGVFSAPGRRWSVARGSGPPSCRPVSPSPTRASALAPASRPC